MEPRSATASLAPKSLPSFPAPTPTDRVRPIELNGATSPPSTPSHSRCRNDPTFIHSYLSTNLRQVIWARRRRLYYLSRSACRSRTDTDDLQVGRNIAWQMGACMLAQRRRLYWTTGETKAFEFIKRFTLHVSYFIQQCECETRKNKNLNLHKLVHVLLSFQSTHAHN